MLVTYQYHDAKWPIWDWIKKISEGDTTHESMRIQDETLWIDVVYEARFAKRIKPIPWGEWKYKDSIVRKVEFEKYGKNKIAEMLKWLKKQEWKKYDWIGIFSFIWFWIPIRNGRWFCSEFCYVHRMKFIAEVDRYDQKQTPYGSESQALVLKKFYAAQQ